jgi:hypothetical protein
VVSSALDWEPNPRVSVSGGYSYTQIDSDAAVIFFFAGQRQNGRSRYFMQDHSVFFHTRLELHERARLMLGYRVSDDRGQGDRVASGPSELLSSYPLRFQAPQARLTVKVNKRLDWNAGWEYFDYKEKFLTNQNYRANTAYTSLSFRFGAQ